MHMTKEQLEAIFDRIRSWPADKQQEAVEVLEWFDRRDEVYILSDEERAAVKRGLEDSKNRRFATEERVTGVLGKARR